MVGLNSLAIENLRIQAALLLAVQARAEQEITLVRILECHVFSHGHKIGTTKTPTIFCDRRLVHILDLLHAALIILIDARIHDGFLLRVPRNTIHLRLSILRQLHSLQGLASHKVTDHELGEAAKVSRWTLANARESSTIVHKTQVANDLATLVSRWLTGSRFSLLICRHSLQVRHVREVGNVHLVQRVRAQ